MKKILITCVLASASLFSCFSATITVNSASDIANANPSPGDVLLMSKSANWADQDIVADFQGTETNPITLKAEGSGEVILSGGATLQIAGKHVVVDGLTFRQCASTEGGDLVKFRTSASNVAENCRLTNCLFSDNNPSDLNVGYKWVSLYGKNNRVDHCWFELKKHRGTTLVVWLEIGQDPNFHRIDHNYFTRPLLTTGNNEAETIRIGDSQRSLVNSNTIVEYNFFEECDGEIEVISNKSCYNVYRYNTFFNTGAILTLRHGHYCTVDGNYFFGNNASGSGGVRIIGVGHKVINNYMQDLAGSGNLRAPIVLMGGVNGFDEFDATNRYVAAERNTVAFNTIVNCKQNIYIGSDKSSSTETYDAPFNNTIDNNIIYNGDDPVLEFEYGEIASFSYSGNIYHNTTLGTSSSGFTNVNPNLTLGSGFTPARLTAGSPAINAATGSYSLTEDFDGEPRTGTYDVGCDEYNSTEPSRKPLLKTEVGPCFLNPTACEVLEEDCAGVVGGTASVDECGVCSGGNTGTPINNCAQDCNGTYNGTAAVDNCGICSGGTTGIDIDACLECGAPFATHEDDIHIAANVIDMDPDTRWSGFGIGEYLEICLDDTLTLNNIAMSFYKGNERSTFFEIAVSLDGQNWTTVVPNGESSGLSLDLEDFGFELTQAWKLRIVGKGNDSPSDWTSITEVEWGLVTGTNSAIRYELLSIYPNPTDGIVQFNQNLGNQLVEVTDVFGKTVQSGSANELNISNLDPGVFFIKVASKTLKIIKK